MTEIKRPLRFLNARADGRKYYRKYIKQYYATLKEKYPDGKQHTFFKIIAEKFGMYWTRVENIIRYDKSDIDLPKPTEGNTNEFPKKDS